MFHDLNDLFFIFYEKQLSNSNNVTKKIYLKNSINKNDNNNKINKKHNKTIKNI